MAVLTVAGAAAAVPARRVWRSVPARIAAAPIPVWVTTASLLFNIGWPTKLVVASTLALAIVSPAAALLVVAAIAPLGQIVAELIHDPNFRVGEAMILAFLVGCLVRTSGAQRGPTVPLPGAAWLLAAALAASVASLAWQLRDTAATRNAVLHLVYMYYYPAENGVGILDAMRLLEGLALVAVTIALVRERPRLAELLPIALVASAAIAAASSLLLWYHVGVPRALARLASNGYRISGHVTDVNAAGSFFALVFYLAIGMAGRADGVRRVPWIAASVLIGVGLWFSESRTAFGSAALVGAVAIVWVATERLAPRARLVTGAAVVAVVIVTAVAGARWLEANRTQRGAELREQFTATSLRLIAARPLLGVGVGQYATMSPLVLSPQLAWTYGAENAHDYFLQIAAETGIVGFGLFAVWVGAGVLRMASGIQCAPRDARLIGTTAGVAAFLGTCLGGHPLLIGEVAYPFWIQFALGAALAGSTLLNARSDVAGASADVAGATVDVAGASADVTNASSGVAATAADLSAMRADARSGRQRVADGRADASNAGLNHASRQNGSPALLVLVLLAAIAVCAVINAARGPVPLPQSEAIDGLSPWQTAADGTRFRWTDEYASVIVGRDVQRVRIPLRVPTDRPAISPMPVYVSIGGSKPERMLVGDTWTILDADLSGQNPLAPVKRVNLKVERTWRPALYVAGSAEMRPVGVQVGECELVRQP